MKYDIIRSVGALYYIYATLFIKNLEGFLLLNMQCNQNKGSDIIGFILVSQQCHN